MFPARMWSLLLFVGLLSVPVVRNAAAVEEKLVPDSLYQPCQHHDPLMNGTHERFRGQDVVWQIPQNARAILFLVHGGERTPLTFFDFGPKCKLCYGLPEDRRATLDALKNGYAVIALKSIGPRWDVWPLETSPDIDNAIALVQLWTKKHHLEALPLVGWGHSKGGEFAASLAATYKMPLQALVIMCAADFKNQALLANPQFPPTKFVYMSGQRYESGLPSEAEVEEVMNTLIHRGVSVSSRRCSPKSLSPFYLAKRIHCVNRHMSEKLFEAMRAENLLDGENYLTVNPMTDEFEGFMERSHALPFCSGRNELCLAPDVVQELQVAYNVHSFTSEANREIFSWFDSTLELGAEGIDMPKLPNEHGSMWQ